MDEAVVEHIGRGHQTGAIVEVGCQFPSVMEDQPQAQEVTFTVWLVVILKS